MSPSSPIFAAQPPKAGKSCSKVGVLKIHKDKSYQCVKLQQKSIWKVLNLEKKASTAPSPAAAKRIELTFQNILENSQLVPLRAWQNASEKFATPANAISVSVLVGPNSVTLNPRYKEIISKVSQIFSQSAQPNSVTILNFGLKDKDWAAIEGAKFLQRNQTFSRDWIDRWACPSEVRCWGAGSYMGAGVDKHLIVIATGVSHRSHLNGNIEAHEFTHNIQQEIMQEGFPWPLRDPWPPMWFTEGQANFAAMMVAGNTFADYSQNRLYVLSNTLKNKEITKEYLENFLLFNYSSNIDSSDLWYQYEIGTVFAEILIAIGGPDASMKIWNLAQEGYTFERAFETVYKVAFKDVVPDIAETIYKSLN